MWAQAASQRTRALTVMATAILLASACSPSTDTLAALRQADEQPIPGTFGYTLGPADGTPATRPDAIYPDLIGAYAGRDVSVSYAIVRNRSDGIEWGPAWVFFTHDLCYFTAKGDFVSPSRAGLEDGCTDDNMLVQVVDAETGHLVAAFDAFDLEGGWLPSRTEGDQPAWATEFQ